MKRLHPSVKGLLLGKGGGADLSIFYITLPKAVPLVILDFQRGLEWRQAQIKHQTVQRDQRLKGVTDMGSVQ